MNNVAQTRVTPLPRVFSFFSKKKLEEQIEDARFNASRYTHASIVTVSHGNCQRKNRGKPLSAREFIYVSTEGRPCVSPEHRSNCLIRTESANNTDLGKKKTTYIERKII